MPVRWRLNALESCSYGMHICLSLESGFRLPRSNIWDFGLLVYGMENVIKLIIILHSSAGYSFVIEDIKQ